MTIFNKFESILQTSTAKKILLSLLIGIAVTGFASEYAKDVKADIAKNVVRFHVLANSNADYDQKLKLKVRDAVINYLEDKLENAENVEETKRILASEAENIRETAKSTVASEGYAYDVNVVMGEFDFPTKKYGDSQFPPGRYYALRVLIGEAKGENWWCVLYPQLCFTANAAGKMPEKSKQKLKNVLTDDEYNIVTNPNGKIAFKFKFKLLELFSF